MTINQAFIAQACGYFVTWTIERFIHRLSVLPVDALFSFGVGSIIAMIVVNVARWAWERIVA